LSPVRRGRRETMKAKLMVTAALTAASTVTAVAEPVLKFPNRYEYAMARLGGSEYFHCDYTTKTCLRGSAYRGRFVGEQLADDRTTVLAHISCDEYRCYNYDTGVIWNKTGVVGQFKEDLPRHCVDDFIRRGEPCDLSIIPVGSKWGLQANVMRCKERPTTAFDMQGCRTGVNEIVVVDKVDNFMACVRTLDRPEGSGCMWVNKSNLATLN
jgi:hypothetical protein